MVYMDMPRSSIWSLFGSLGMFLLVSDLRGTNEMSGSLDLASFLPEDERTSAEDELTTAGHGRTLADTSEQCPITVNGFVCFWLGMFCWVKYA